MHDVLVSVVIPVYNVESYIGTCLKSIVNQTYTKLQIVVINDGSTDNTLQIVQKFAEDDNRIVLIDKSNEGVSVARNYGIDAAVGSYLMFVDGDDWADVDMIEKLLNRAIDNDVDFSGAGFIFEDIASGRKRFSRHGFTPQIIVEKDILESYFLGHYLWGSVWGGIYRSSIIKDNHLYFERGIKYGEDVFFNAQFMSKAKRVIVGDEHYYHVLIRPSSATRQSVHELREVKEANYPEFLQREGLWQDYKEAYYVWYIRSCNYKMYHLALKVSLKDYRNFYQEFIKTSNYKIYNTTTRRKRMRLRDRVLSLCGLSAYLSWVLMFIPTLLGKKILV